MLKKLMLSTLLTILLIGCGEERPKQLNVFTWANYVSDEIKSGFEKEFNVRVVVDTFANNEDLLTKLQSGASGYDIIMPSDYMVAIMIKENLLAELALHNIPNFKNISPQFKGKYFDPENRYSLPYTWGTAGIGYDSSVVNPPPESWSILWDERYSRKFSMLDDQRETIGVALKLLGYSVNSTNLEELMAAKQKLIEQKPLVKQYKSEADEILSSGDVIMAHCWSGDALRAAATRPTIKYVIPKEGTTQFIDTICIPKSAPHKAVAEQFINYLLRPEINAKITEFTKYGTCVSEARNYVSQALRNEPGIYPSEEVLSKFESLRDLGDFTPNYDRAWTEVKAK
jgi:spermidine/putrescine-binding protein